MKNKYIICGDTAIIYIKYSGNYIKAMIDKNDIDKVGKYKGTWFGRWDNRNIYVSVWDYVDGKRTLVNIHRAIMEKHTELPFIDHKNGDTLDNRKCNLRFCNSRENSQNRKARKGSSKYKGVSWYKRKNKWEASIYVNDKTIHLGMYKGEEDAALAYNKAASFYFGEFARLNAV